LQSELVCFLNLTATDRSLLTNNVGAAIHTSGGLGTQRDEIASLARQAFVDSMGTSLWIAMALAVCATLIAVVLVPRHKDHHVLETW
jgi:ABC-type Fe3+ transport system permease subunit